MSAKQARSAGVFRMDPKILPPGSSQAFDYKAAGRTAQVHCGCIFAFVDGIERRIVGAPGIDVYEVRLIRPCVTRAGNIRAGKEGCMLSKNSVDKEFYLPSSYIVRPPDDGLAAELGAKFG